MGGQDNGTNYPPPFDPGPLGNPTVIAPAPQGEQHSGQVRMAYRLAAEYTGKLLHVAGIGWHVWDGTRWVFDKEDKIATVAVVAVLKDAIVTSMGDKQLRSDATRCESIGGIKGVLGIAAALADFATDVDDLNADPWLLNCANGTLDLRSRTVRPFDPADRITKVARGAYDPNADLSVWAGFLDRVLPDPEVRAYLQRVFGLSVYGRVREHLFPVLTGTGANGKGTAYGAVLNAFGDYAIPVSPETLITSTRGGVGGPEMMTLIGARLVIGSETAKGSKLDEATMKRLTGGDILTARNHYKAPVSWKPSHQLVYVTNHLPEVSGSDPAVWRRLRVVPFKVEVPVEEWDLELGETLELHADAVLSWVVGGYFDYEDNGGMREPASVVRATGEYHLESDVVARFVEEACQVGPQCSETTRSLYSLWQPWAIEDGATPMTERAFGKELDRLGYTVVRDKRGAARPGLGARDLFSGGPVTEVTDEYKLSNART